MPAALRFTALMALSVNAALGTIIIAVGTNDGLLVCEDRRLTIKSGDGKVSFADGNKSQQIGKFGFFAISGDVSGGMTNAFGQSFTAFDLLAEIPAFFKNHDIQVFDEPMALEFEAHLRDQLSRRPVSAVQAQKQEVKSRAEVLLYWMDRTGAARLYVVDMTVAASRAGGAAAAQRPSLIGQFLPVGLFQTSKPVVRGSGVLGYNAVATGSDPGLDELRQDDELKPFLKNFVSAASVDSIAAARSLKKLIRSISDRQQSIRAGGLDVGPESDCFLGTLDGIKNINQ